jgi:hypothetical protein
MSYSQSCFHTDHIVRQNILLDGGATNATI